jgi:paraquat-inducible protein A
MQRVPEALGHEVVECARCRRVLISPAAGRIDLPLALAGCALFLLIGAASTPLMSVSTLGASRMSWLSSGVYELNAQGFPELALLVFICSVLLPFVYVGALVWVLANLHFARESDPSHKTQSGNPALGITYRWLLLLRPWMMIEVFLIGAFVAYTRIEAIAEVEIHSGGWCLLAATFALLLALTQLDDRTVWAALGPQTRGASPHLEGAPVAGKRTVACTVCDLIVEPSAKHTHCSRCHARLHSRKPDALRRTTALLLAGYLLYIPANLLPVMTITQLGRVEEHTIMSGVMELVRSDLWPLAVIVFVASIVLPLMKLFGLTWMLLAIQLGSSRLLETRTRLLRMIDVIGRWSNIDVFMSAVLVALLQFGVLTSVRVGSGLLAFAAVVVITMFATLSFDPRLMWDAGGTLNGRARRSA